ncbi:MAG TPA: ABC transporter ATP-binding protein [Candidatus Dorea gallistercoris]|uniref:Spermidine/putrescine import ATP-binding protein PotA n=1 Tax=Candidatus Dorea gallistercoris TaxID=2838542 RepID=A0A9D1UF99_9FIRM|nr:ABC transporter ATP-binding protein [Candidatus Dorea gallistercoris]
MQDVILELDKVSKTFDDKKVLNSFSLEIKRNEFITLLGPSGCGKSTTLRIIGGFEKPDEGRVLFDGKDITGLSPDKRNVNTVFQKYSLFPHMNVEENIAFGLKLKKKSQQYVRDKIQYALKLVNMEGYEKRSPMSLSGGQQQRVAIARAIVNEPKVLLLDEPLGALDLKLRHDMQRELIKIKKEVGITFIYVTHDQEEALTMSDRIIVMNKGIIQQIGTSKSIYDEPQNAFVADFIGDSNIIDGIMRRDCLVEIQGVDIPCVDVGFGTNELVDVVIRPEDLVVTEPEQGFLKGMVVSVIFKGAVYEIKVQVGDYEWMIESVNPAQVGAQVGLTILPDNIQIMHKPHSEDAEVIREDE